MVGTVPRPPSPATDHRFHGEEFVLRVCALCLLGVVFALLWQGSRMQVHLVDGTYELFARGARLIRIP